MHKSYTRHAITWLPRWYHVENNVTRIPHSHNVVSTWCVCWDMPKRASNMASKAELGRFPLMKNIMIAVLKFNERSNLLNNSDLLRKAVISQAHLNKNSNNSSTYVQFNNRLKEQLNIHFVLKRNNKTTCTKQLLKCFGISARTAYIKGYTEIFNSLLQEKRENPENKLHLYALVKKTFNYENYLNSKFTSTNNALTRFRLSTHWLPIERGRYNLTPRNQRICPFCEVSIGDEFHSLMKCAHKDIENLRSIFLNKIYQLTPQLRKLSDLQQFLYLLQCHDVITTDIFGAWVDKCNMMYKTKL